MCAFKRLFAHHGAMSDGRLLLRVTVSDPWEFVDGTGSNVFRAHGRKTSSADGRPSFPLLLELNEPVQASAVEATALFVAESRDDYEALQEGQVVMCRLTGVPDVQLEGADPFDVSGWRGRFPAARADLQRV